MGQPALNEAKRFAHIDGVRAVAVLLVVVAHAGVGHIVPGGSGVTLFFTVSGFIITYLLIGERAKTGGFRIGGFYSRRALKIFPPFALIVVLPTLIWSLWNPVSWEKFAAQVFFVFNWVKIDGDTGILPGSGVVWSLAIEEQFYIAFALMWILLLKTRHWLRYTAVLATCVIGWSVAARVLLAANTGMEDRIYYGTDTRMDGIAIGVLAAILLTSWSTTSASTWYSRLLGSDWCIVIAVAIYLASLVIRDDWFRSTLRFSFQSIAAAILILAPFMTGDGPLRKAFVRASAWKPVATIGLASYSIYLVHLSLIVAIEPSLAPLPLLLRVFVLAAIGVGVGVAIYYLVEVPILRWRKHRSRLARTTVVAARNTSV